jgi:hypothetical protein
MQNGGFFHRESGTLGQYGLSLAEVSRSVEAIRWDGNAHDSQVVVTYVD